jgi:hypothetical protein
VTFLRNIGIEIAFGEGGATLITICESGLLATPVSEGMQSSVPSASSAKMLNSNSINGFEPGDVRTVSARARSRLSALIP